MISAIQWVPNGAFQLSPDRYELADEEIKMLKKWQNEHISSDQQSSKNEILEHMSDTDVNHPTTSGANDSESDSGPSKAEISAMDDSTFMRALQLENYDSDNDVTAPAALLHSGGFEADFGQDEDDLSDRDDYELKMSDALIISGKTEDEHASINVHVYDAETGSLYVHHDFAIPSFPLAIEWLNLNPRCSQVNHASSQGSFVAIGSFETAIEIWNLDVIDVLEPIATLGGINDDSKTSTRNTDSLSVDDSHTDAVMCLAWTPMNRNRLASGSADMSVKVWNIMTRQCTITCKHHQDKVQSIAWHPMESSMLASGAFDKSISVTDIRTPQSCMKFNVDADVETLSWNPHNAATIGVACESGTFTIIDVRMPVQSKPILHFNAHEQACTGMSFNRRIPNLFATGSTDGCVKLWDITDIACPTLVATKPLKIGDVFTVQFSLDDAALLSAGGSEGILAVWDITENADVEARYMQYCKKSRAEY